MYAIFKAKGKQWRAEPGATLRLPSLQAEPGDRVVFDEVLLADHDGSVMVGRPSLNGASVATEVVRHGKGEKIIVFKMKRRKGYRRKQGHRQAFTEVKVVDITLGSGKAAGKKAAKKTEEPATAKAEEPKAEKPKAGKKAAPEKEEAAPEPKAEAAEEPATEAPSAQAVAEAIDQVDITPAAAELAEENRLDVSALEGTGKDGRILKSDVEKAIKQRDEEG